MMNSNPQYNTGSDDMIIGDTGANTLQDYKGDVGVYKSLYPVFFRGSPTPLAHKGVVKQSTLDSHAKKIPTEGQK